MTASTSIPSADQGHYTGLVAEWYDDFLAGENGDLALYCGLLREEGGPVLELACGTGRLILALLREGKDVDGVDLSAEMLARCRAKVEAAGYSAGLFRQPMEKFDTGRRYGSVVVTGGSFQLVPTLEGARSALAAVHRHLRPGGRLIMDLVIGPAPFGGTDPNIWQIGRIAVRGRERVVYSCRTVSDSFVQQSHLLTRYEHFRNDRLVETLGGELLLREYSRIEAELLLREQGFEVERVEQRRVMSTHSVSALFLCRRTESNAATAEPTAPTAEPTAATAEPTAPTAATAEPTAGRPEPTAATEAPTAGSAAPTAGSAAPTARTTDTAESQQEIEDFPS